MNKVFGAGYPTTEEGWFDFPNDADYRSELFPQNVNEHSAKANVYLIQAIIEFVSEAEDTIADIMAGSGTIMVGALMGRKVICIEISQKYCKMMLDALVYLEQYHNTISDQITIINQPCQVVLPLPGIDHIIFSPPYAQILKSKGTDKLTMEKTSYDMVEYHQGALNVGQLNEFLYNQKMEEVYKLCYESLPAGGTMTVIIKDHIRDNQRVYLSKWVVDCCTPIGFELLGWYKQKSLGSVYTRIYRSQGRATVDDEDVIILRKRVSEAP